MKCVASLVVSFATAGAAMAGGLAAPVVEAEPVAVAVAPVNDWTGAYVGLQFGQGSAEASFLGMTSDVDFDAYGLHAGYLWDLGQYVLGAELDFNRLSLDEDGGDADLVRLRGRVGYDAGRILPYLTLGVAQISADEGGSDLSETGVTYGIGGDFLINDNVSIGIEYSRSDFSDVEGISGLDLDADMVQLRASYRF